MYEFQVFTGADRLWYWRLWSIKNRKSIAIGGKGYAGESNARRGVRPGEGRRAKRAGAGPALSAHGGHTRRLTGTSSWKATRTDENSSPSRKTCRQSGQDGPIGKSARR